MNSRETTNYLKAFAILAVCINHFINGYITNSLIGYAYGFISIFFLLSGYGIYHSLEHQIDKSFSEFIISFIKKRLMRIYPLFWLYCILTGFPDGIMGFFALDFVHPKTPWFVPAIVQCYILAPFLFILTNRIKLKYIIPAIFSVFLIVNILLFAERFSPIESIGYHGLFFLNIFQFFLGYILAKIEKSIPCPKYFVYCSFLLLFFFIQETTPQSLLSFSGKRYLFPLLLSFTVFIFCLSLLSSTIVLPLKNVMNFIGIHSFSIYLFNGLSARVLSMLGIIHRDNTQCVGILVWIITLPFFFMLFAALETLLNEFLFGKKTIKESFGTYIKNLQQIYYKPS